ncbi:MAG: tRNA 2-thiouridine(34) synthase MnmA, partial [Clostridia bacterium]|nr:tRNA 2-thiouridine(34) synthase MnmA [Clostridia bacterium]
KCRYRQEDAPGRAVYKDGKLTAYFDEPQRAITEGQYLVVYDNDGLCLGGGAIDVVIK